MAAVVTRRRSAFTFAHFQEFEKPRRNAPVVPSNELIRLLDSGPCDLPEREPTEYMAGKTASGGGMRNECHQEFGTRNADNASAAAVATEDQPVKYSVLLSWVQHISVMMMMLMVWLKTATL